MEDFISHTIHAYSSPFSLLASEGSAMIESHCFRLLSSQERLGNITHVAHSAMRATRMSSSQADKEHHHGNRETTVFEDHIFPVARRSCKPHHCPHPQMPSWRGEGGDQDGPQPD